MVKRIAVGNGKYCYTGPNCQLHGLPQIAKTKQSLYEAEEKLREIKSSLNSTAEEVSNAQTAVADAQKAFDATTEGQSYLRNIISRFDGSIVEGEPLWYARRDFMNRLAAAEAYADKLENANKSTSTKKTRDWEEQPDKDGLVGVNLAPTHTYTPPTFHTPDPDSMYSRVVGSKYEETIALSRQEIKKLLSQDIKEAIAKNYIPSNLKYSLRSGRYSLELKVQGLRDSAIWRDERLAGGLGGYSPEAQELYKRLKDMVNAYNSISSHPEIDYFNSRYHSNVGFEDKYGREWRLKRAEIAKRKREEAKTKI